jgi:molecular chaperone GrpE
VTNDEQIMDEAAVNESQNDGIEPEVEEPVLALEEQLAEAKAEAARNLDGWQRTQAEFANARKRFEKQRSDTYLNANVDLVSKVLPLIDDFERALESAPGELQNDAWVSGVALIYRKMVGILEEMNVQVIPTVGETFDPNWHEALSQEPSDEYENGTVVREMRRGYRLGDRVIRPALVTVAG